MIRTRLRIFVCGLLCLVVSASLADEPLQNFKKLYLSKQYFELRDALKAHRADQSPEILFYRAVISNKFNKPRLSIIQLDEYLKKAKADADSDLLAESYELLADNYLKTFQYSKAANSYNALLTRFPDKRDAKEKSDIQNAIKLWGALGKVPPQTAIIKNSSTIKKDKEGHFPLTINNQNVAFAFDTGANLSVITNSLATRLKLDVIDASIDVVAVAGNVVKAKLAVARQLRIGNAIISNAVFLVFDDKDLYVAEANFQINGLIGFPVIEALRQVVFLRDGELSISVVRTKPDEQNLCLDGLTPLIVGWYKGERLIFAFDTGANRSTLYPPFYKRYEAEVTASYKKHTERVRGVGGFRELNAYLAKDLLITIGGKQARYEQIPILTERTNSSSEHFYGNLGQDLVKQFERMTINFETMSLKFE